MSVHFVFHTVDWTQTATMEEDLAVLVGVQLGGVDDCGAVVLVVLVAVPVTEQREGQGEHISTTCSAQRSPPSLSPREE